METMYFIVVCSLIFFPLTVSKSLTNSDIDIDEIFNYGPYQVGETSYEYPLMNDTELTPSANNLTTQIRGQLFFPMATNNLKTNRSPVLIFLPGKHPDCRLMTPPGYPKLDLESVDSSGVCPNGFSTVPSHLGFSYLGRYFASHGYIVSSIDVLMINNQWGIPGDKTLNFVRARLVLRTLEKMIEWDSSSDKSKQILSGVDLSGRFDFNHVGLMGHSRGGEGVRNAYVMLMENRGPSDASKWRMKLPNVNIRAIVEIAPMYYGQNGTKFGVENIPWAMIVSGCEDDEIDYAHVYLANYQRQTSKSINYVIHVYGANHEYFNTEWQTGLNMCFGDQDPLWDVNAPTFQVGDLFPPARNTSLDLTLLKINGSELQRRTAIFVLATFFRGYVGIDANLAYAQFLEPSAPLPRNFTEIGREYFDNSRDTIIFRNSGNIVASEGVQISLLKDYGQRNFQTFATAYDNSPVPPPYFTFNPAIKGNLSLGCVNLIETGFYIDFAANRSSEIWLGFTGLEKKPLINVDIQWARRSSCWFNAINSSICAEPREMPIEIELRTESNVVAQSRTSMKSRFNLQYARCDAMDFPPENIAFLPVMFETFRISANRSLAVTSLRIRAVNGGSLILGDITARIATTSTGSFIFISSLHLFVSTILIILIH